MIWRFYHLPQSQTPNASLGLFWVFCYSEIYKEKEASVASFMVEIIDEHRSWRSTDIFYRVTCKSIPAEDFSVFSHVFSAPWETVLLRKPNVCAFSRKFCGTVDREGLDLNPSSVASLFHGCERHPPPGRISQNPVPSHNLVFPGNSSLQEDLLYCIELSSVFPDLRASHFLEAPHSTVWHLLESEKGVNS